ncbi:unnamed protein product [Brassica oleracea var. botrytis]|uniref:(rape) hypothetical protein n=1 Tax=Brassica napus TaxID=3708 RepID=A0A816U5P1_BRANA|nr:unnamed protein product [Brassica napus]
MIFILTFQATMMPATINVNRLATHQPSLKAGSVYSLTGFDVARCNPNYRLSDSSLLIRFSDTTSFVEVTKPAVPIPLESFRFRNHSEMLGLSNSNNQLSDLIGEITAVKSTVTDPLQDKNRVMATIKMYNGTLVTMSLFDTHAVAIYNRLEKMGSDPRVVVATSINPKMLGGRLFLNATSGTHIYFDKETAASTAAGESFFNRLVGEATGVTPAAPLLRGYAKVDALTIAELNNFVITAPSHDIDFICNGRGLKSRWIRDGAMFRAQTVPRNFNAPPHRSHVCLLITLTQLVSSDTYRVEMSIADETGEGLFVCFDGVMTKLHNMRISEALSVQFKKRGRGRPIKHPDVCSSSSSVAHLDQPPWLSATYSISNSTPSISQRGKIDTASSKKARFIRKAICVRKKEMRLRKSADKKEPATSPPQRDLTINIKRETTNQTDISIKIRCLTSPLGYLNDTTTDIMQHMLTYHDININSAASIVEATNNHVNGIVSRLTDYQGTNIHIVMNITDYNPRYIHRIDVDLATINQEAAIRAPTNDEEDELCTLCFEKLGERFLSTHWNATMYSITNA